MNKSDEDTIRWAIEKYWRSKTDEQIAKGLMAPLEQVVQMREQMNLQRNQKGKESLKSFAQRYLLELSEEEKAEFIRKLPPELIWRMAEGNPATSGQLDIGIEPIKIDITTQLLKVYGKDATKSLGGRPAIVPEYREIGG